VLLSETDDNDYQQFCARVQPCCHDAICNARLWRGPRAPGWTPAAGRVVSDTVNHDDDRTPASKQHQEIHALAGRVSFAVLFLIMSVQRASRRKARMLGFAVALVAVVGFLATSTGLLQTFTSGPRAVSRRSWLPSSALSDRRAPLASRIICVMTSEEMTDVPEAWRSVLHPRRHGMIGLEPVPARSGNLAGCSGEGAAWRC
jgi:hypothetical protein